MTQSFLLQLKHIKIGKLFDNQSFAGSNNLSIGVYPGRILCLFSQETKWLQELILFITGYSRIFAGQIVLSGKDITAIPPEKRPIGIISDAFPLFPNHSVFDSIAYVGILRRWPKNATHTKTNSLISLLGLERERNKTVQELQPLEIFKTKIARTLMTGPQCICIDNTMKKMEFDVRQESQWLIRRLANSLSLTMLVTTDDGQEALTVGDDITIVSHGQVLQSGKPLLLLNRPANVYVAKWIGQCNIINGYVVSLHEDIAEVLLPSGVRIEAMATPYIDINQLGQICIRPDRIAVAFGIDDKSDFIHAQLVDWLLFREYAKLRFRLADGVELFVHRPISLLREKLKPMMQAYLAWQAQHAVIFPLQ